MPEAVDRRRERPWLIAFVVVIAAALAAAPWLADRWGAWTTSLQDEAAAVVSELDEATDAASGSVLLVLTDDERLTRSVALVTKPAGEPGVLAVAPSRLFLLLPGFGDFPLEQATVFEGGDLASLAVQNAFGVRIDHVVEVSTAELAAWLGGAVEVTLPAPVIGDSGSGPQLIADAGTGTYAPDVAVSLLALASGDEQLAWLERQASVWEAIFASARPELTRALAERNGDAGTIFADALSPIQVVLLPVERSAGAGDSDGFTVDAAKVPAFLASRLPHLSLGADPRPRAEVLNGNGRLQTTRPVVEALVRSGFVVVRTDNAERFDFPVTLIIAQGNENRPSGERAAAAIGLGSVQLELTSPSGVVDVSIIVGQDVPAGEG